jgi:hypothetical protein
MPRGRPANDNRPKRPARLSVLGVPGDGRLISGSRWREPTADASISDVSWAGHYWCPRNLGGVPSPSSMTKPTHRCQTLLLSARSHSGLSKPMQRWPRRGTPARLETEPWRNS